jgi:hypothetical protein
MAMFNQSAVPPGQQHVLPLTELLQSGVGHQEITVHGRTNPTDHQAYKPNGPPTQRTSSPLGSDLR